MKKGPTVFVAVGSLLEGKSMTSACVDVYKLGACMDASINWDLRFVHGKLKIWIMMLNVSVFIGRVLVCVCV